MADLRLPLKAIYFDQIKSGVKVIEYRLCTAYWAKRLEGRNYDHLVLTKGYPKADAKERHLILPYRGYTKTTIKHSHFGDQPVEVYAITCQRGA